MRKVVSKGISWRFKCWAKWMLFPGTNLHARLRYRRLPQHFGGSDRKKTRRVLDAGSGNGMLAYKAWEKGNQVLAISFKSNEVDGCRKLFNQYLGIDQKELEFQAYNLYEIDLAAECLDEVICSETLEHVLRDGEVCRTFWRLLKPGGVLHLCSPNAEHPYNATFPLDVDENGGHVRAGYTLESYRALLHPIGFQIVGHEGLGGPVRQWFNRNSKEMQSRFGRILGVPFFVAASPFLRLDEWAPHSTSPFSLYVEAVKPERQ